jgi:hypothetical protein
VELPSLGEPLALPGTRHAVKIFVAS